MADIVSTDEAADAQAPVTEALSPAQLQRAAANGSLWTLLQTVLGIPIAFTANAVVARALGPAEYGDLAVISMLMSIAVLVTNLGVSQGVQQWGAAAHARGDASTVDDVLRASLGFHLLVQLPMLVAVALFVGRGQPVWLQFALLFWAVLPPALGSSSLCISIENRTASSAKLGLLVNLLTQAVVAVSAVLTHAPTAVWVSRSLVPVVCQPINRLLLTSHRRRVCLQARAPRRMPAGFWRFCLMTCAASLLGLLVTSRSEILVLEWLGDSQMVGAFALAFGIAAQLRGPIEALLAPMLPGVAGIVEAHPQLAERALHRAMGISAMLTAGILLGLPFLVAVTPLIYGSEFRASAALLPALAIATLAQALVNPLKAFAQAQRSGGRILASNVMSLTVDIAVACALVPWLGVVGAVVAAITAQVVSTYLMASIQVGRGITGWRQMCRSAAPLLVAVPVMVVPSTIWLLGEAWQAIALYVLGLVLWIVGMRNFLDSRQIDDIRIAAKALPRVTHRVAERGVRILEGHR